MRPVRDEFRCYMVQTVVKFSILAEYLERGHEAALLDVGSGNDANFIELQNSRGHAKSKLCQTVFLFSHNVLQVVELALELLVQSLLLLDRVFSFFQSLFTLVKQLS